MTLKKPREPNIREHAISFRILYKYLIIYWSQHACTLTHMHECAHTYSTLLDGETTMCNGDTVVVASPVQVNPVS